MTRKSTPGDAAPPNDDGRVYIQTFDEHGNPAGWVWVGKQDPWRPWREAAYELLGDYDQYRLKKLKR